MLVASRTIRTLDSSKRRTVTATVTYSMVRSPETMITNTRSIGLTLCRWLSTGQVAQQFIVRSSKGRCILYDVYRVRALVLITSQLGEFGKARIMT